MRAPSHSGACSYQLFRHPERTDLFCAVLVGDIGPDFIVDVWTAGGIYDPDYMVLQGFDPEAALFACSIQGFHVFSVSRGAHVVGAHLAAA